MKHRGVVITAGFNRSLPALAAAELLAREEVPVRGFLVVSPYSLRRLRRYVKKRGWGFIRRAALRMLGRRKQAAGEGSGLLERYLEQNSIPDISLKKWASRNGADFLSVSSLNTSRCERYLRKTDPAWLIYSGGGILDQSIIETAEGKVLNAHQGPLPEVRGMNACEWAVLMGYRTVTTIHLIDRGIDTGPVITEKPFGIEPGDTLDSLREKAIVQGIEGLVEVGREPTLEACDLRENHGRHRLCYVMSDAVRELAAAKVKRKVQERE